MAWDCRNSGTICNNSCPQRLCYRWRTEKDTAKEKIPTQAVGNVSDDVTKEALSVIRGNYGNNPDRRRLLKERYQEIQNKVNEMYRNGQVK